MTTTRLPFELGSVLDQEAVQPFSPETVQRFLDAVGQELLKQEAAARGGRFGGTHILPGGPDWARLPILLEEVGEVARELNERLIVGLMDVDRTDLQNELVQVAACAVAWAAAIEEGRA